MTRERFWFLVGNVASLAAIIGPVVYPPLAILASPEVQAAILAGGTVAVNAVRDIVQSAK